MNIPNYKIYLINLDRAKERLELMHNQFEKYNIEYERVEAIDAKELDDNIYCVENKYDRSLVSGEIGCYLSHVKTLNKFINSENDFAIIIEDDAILQDDFKDIIEKTLLDYDNLVDKDKWDILKLYNGKRKHIKIKNIDDKYLIGACGTSIPITTIAAIWTKEAAEKFLKKVFIDKKVIIRRPIDCDLQHPWEYNLRIYNLLPSIVKSAPIETQIQINDNLRKANFLKQIKYEINRLFPKYMYFINHHGFTKFYNSFILKKNKVIR